MLAVASRLQGNELAKTSLKRSSEVTYLYSLWISHLAEIAPQSAQKNINLKILSALPIPDLPISGQRRIATYLDDLQAKVDSLKQLQAETATELATLLPAVLDRAFKGEL